MTQYFTDEKSELRDITLTFHGHKDLGLKQNFITALLRHHICSLELLKQRMGTWG